MERIMPSAEHIALVKVATILAHDPALRGEILCSSDSKEGQRSYECTEKQHWNEAVEKKTRAMLKNLGLPEELQERLVGVVLSIGLKMLTWATYHEIFLGVSREYSINFLNSSFFTQLGIFDGKKAAQALIEDNSLSVRQKYKLASLYCFVDHIFALEGFLSDEEKECSRYECPEIIRPHSLMAFWSSLHNSGSVVNFSDDKAMQLSRLGHAVASGSKAAVEYFLGRTNANWKAEAIAEAALETVKRELRTQSDWFLFKNWCRIKFGWLPNENFIEILLYLLSIMAEDQQIKFLQDSTCVTNEDGLFGDKQRGNILGYFLNWPYQDYLMEMAAKMWEFLPEVLFNELLLKICKKIEPKKTEILKYGEEKYYNYRRLLKEFWCESPQHLKRSLFQDNVLSVADVASICKGSEEVMYKLFALENFTNVDLENIELILYSATDQEREDIISSKGGLDFCCRLMKGSKWNLLTKVLSIFFPSDEQMDEFKRKLSLMESAQHVCIDLIKLEQWNLAEAFITWSSSCEERKSDLKKAMINSDHGRQVCIDMITYDKGMEAVDKFIRWYLPSEEEIKAFKKELIFSSRGVLACVNLVTYGRVEFLEEFIDSCLSSEAEIKQLKRKVADSEGSWVLYHLISGQSMEDIYDWDNYNIFARVKDFQGGKWKQVEQFLTWCFSSEEEIRAFKRGLLSVEGQSEGHMGLLRDLHFGLMAADRWGEIETLIAWLEVSDEEIRQLKKESLLSEWGMRRLSEILQASHLTTDSPQSRPDNIDLFLRWCLLDEEAVCTFKDNFDKKYGFQSFQDTRFICKFTERNLNGLYTLIDLLLADLRKETEEKSENSPQKLSDESKLKEMKRKSEASLQEPPTKRFQDKV